MTSAEEKYLKAIFQIAERDGATVTTGAIATRMRTSSASVTDMLKKLADKDLVAHEKYYGAKLTAQGRRIATTILRRHRLWETFLVQQLGYGWDRVHDLAEELQHIGDQELADKLDAFLGHPGFDPHGDPIPTPEGKWKIRSQVQLGHIQPGIEAKVVGVRDQSPDFLHHLDSHGIRLNTVVRIAARSEYDHSLLLTVDGQSLTLSNQAANNVFVQLQKPGE